jgi:hypothetical protein
MFLFADADRKGPSGIGLAIDECPLLAEDFDQPVEEGWLSQSNPK